MSRHFSVFALVMSLSLAPVASFAENIYGDLEPDGNGGFKIVPKEDNLTGTAGDDYIDGRKLNDTINGGDGDDDIYGGLTGDDLLFGNAGEDYISGGNGSDTIYGGADDDDILGNTNSVTSDGNNNLYGGSGSDHIMGSGGNDYMSGGGVGRSDGSDQYFPSNGIGVIVGGVDVDAADLDYNTTSADGANNVSLGGGDDYADGGIKADIVNGNSGDDSFNDPQVGKPDKWSGGPGFDTLQYWKSDHGVKLDLSKGKQLGPEGDRISGIEHFSLTIYPDTIVTDYEASDTASSSGFLLEIDADGGLPSTKGDHVTVLGPARNATLPKHKWGAYIWGSDGNDFLTGGNLRDRIDAGKGDDVIEGNDGNDELSGFEGDDTIYGDDGNDQILTDLGSDTLYGGKGRERLDCGAKYSLTTFKSFTDGALDHVIYLGVDESPNVRGKIDEITSFDPRQDRFHFSRYFDADSTKPGTQRFKYAKTLGSRAGYFSIKLKRDKYDLSYFELLAETNGKAGADFRVDIYPFAGKWASFDAKSFVVY